MSDVKCAKMLIRAAERDFRCAQIHARPNEYTPFAVAFRY